MSSWVWVPRTNTILQAAFFKITGIIPIEKAVEYMKAAIVKSYGKKGEKVVNMNYAAVEAGVQSVVAVDVPADWADARMNRQPLRWTSPTLSKRSWNR